jgi:hypothetical protein
MWRIIGACVLDDQKILKNRSNQFDTLHMSKTNFIIHDINFGQIDKKK